MEYPNFVKIKDMNGDVGDFKFEEIIETTYFTVVDKQLFGASIGRKILNDIKEGRFDVNEDNIENDEEIEQSIYEEIRNEITVDLENEILKYAIKYIENNIV